MITNKSLAKSFNFLGKLMELHGENKFKIRSYYNAYNNLRKIEKPFSTISDNELLAIPTIGQTIVDKIRELTETGTLEVLEKFKSQTPEGIQEMLTIRGIGPKKVEVIWKDMQIETISELLYACTENRLVKFKGFGLKTQEEVKKNLEYFLASKGKFHFANVLESANELLQNISDQYPNDEHAITGDVARMMPEVDGIEIITTAEDLSLDTIGIFPNEETSEPEFNGFPAFVDVIDPNTFGTEVFLRNCSDEFKDSSGITYDDQFAFEEDLLDEIGLTFIPYEFREKHKTYQLASNGITPTLIENSDIKGIVHNHSTYSDGINTLSEMAERCQQSGYQYLVISDHSQSAFYAQGLNIERVMVQWDEIDQLNQTYNDFKIFKGIESDILNDGSLDYPEEILKGFEVIVASIHSNLKMDEVTATNRLIKAIENPYTTILGHPTGRLLLGRKGYPINHTKIIDAAADNGVSIEINANPQRLDIDWQWVDYAMNKGVLISINPDAHSMDQIDYLKFGVAAGRKGGLTADMCLNTKDTESFEAWLSLRR